MLTTLTRIQIGQVNVVPGDVRMFTTATISECTVAGFINEAQQSSGVIILPTDFIFSACADGSEVFIPTFGDNGVITLQGMTSSGTPGDFTIGGVLKADGFTYPSTDGSAGSAIVTDGSKNLSLQPVVNPYPNLSVPYAAFNYFVSTDNDGTIWSYATTLNGDPYATITDGLHFGTLNFTILPQQAGTYRFTVSYITDTNLGIQNIICDGVTTTIDMYSASTVHGVNLSWEQTMTAGNKTIQLINNGKNASSTDYYMSWCNTEIQIFRVS